VASVVLLAIGATGVSALVPGLTSQSVDATRNMVTIERGQCHAHQCRQATAPGRAHPEKKGRPQSAFFFRGSSQQRPP